MQLKYIFLLTVILLASCSDRSDLDSIVKKDPKLVNVVDRLKATELVYKKCPECKFSGLEGTRLIGYTNRYPPKGLYDRKEIEIGTFQYDAFSILKPEHDSEYRGAEVLYICYFNQAQKKLFNDFRFYYTNRISHSKRFPIIDYVENTAIIRIEVGP